MANTASAVVISSSTKPASDIVKLIVHEEEFLQPTALENGITAYPWHIDTKYYSANINVCGLTEKTIGSETFAESVQAVIINFDSYKNDGISAAEQWEPIFKEWDPEVCILLCERCEENPSCGISKLEAQEWCIARGFELVELNPEKDEEWEQEQDFIETTGIARVIQALHAHVWPDLKMKDQSNNRSRNVQSMLINPSNTTGVKAANCLITNSEGDDGLSEELRNMRMRELAQNGLDPHILDEPLDALGSGGNTDDFFDLFQSLADVKDRVANMASDDRKASAEKVVKAFWKVMGGDSDELSDSSDIEN